jgi:hypothetical protein
MSMYDINQRSWNDSTTITNVSVTYRVNLRITPSRNTMSTLNLTNQTLNHQTYVALARMEHEHEVNTLRFSDSKKRAKPIILARCSRNGSGTTEGLQVQVSIHVPPFLSAFSTLR